MNYVSNVIRYNAKSVDNLLDIANPQAAYYVGLLFADGYIEHRQMAVSIVLRDYDAAVLYSLAEFVGLPHDAVRLKSKNRPEMRRLSICSAYLVRALATYGIVPRKSWEGVPYFPQQSSDALLAFLHGWMDGDGHVKKQCMVAMSTLLQANVFCEYVSQLGGKGTIGRAGKYYRVVLNKRDNMEFLSRLYSQPIVCLQRKVDAFNSFYCRKLNG